jgi:hypothetical protein
MKSENTFRTSSDEIERWLSEPVEARPQRRIATVTDIGPRIEQRETQRMQSLHGVNWKLSVGRENRRVRR